MTMDFEKESPGNPVEEGRAAASFPAAASPRSPPC